jgi:hypothetical protein
MEETFNKIGDYTLRLDAKNYEGSENGVRKYNGYTKLFNFLARQVTTIHRDWLLEGRGSDAAGVAAVATHATLESFDDLPSTGEIKYMYNKLVELGGTPPPLDEILPAALDKKSPRLQAPGKA